MKKKGNSLADLGGMVYSTNPDARYESEQSEESVAPNNQNLEAHLEKKGRGGKVVVLIKGFEGPEEDLKDLAKKLKSHCGTGGSCKNGEILIQGDVREKVMDYLNKNHFRVKRVGG